MLSAKNGSLSLGGQHDREGNSIILTIVIEVTRTAELDIRNGSVTT